MAGFRCWLRHLGKKKDGGRIGAPSRGGRVESGQAAFLAPFADSETVWSNHFVSWAWCSVESLIRSCERWVARSANCVDSSIWREVRSLKSRTVLTSCSCCREYSSTSPAKAYCWRATRSKAAAESSFSLIAGARAFLPASIKALKSKVWLVISGILESESPVREWPHSNGGSVAVQQEIGSAW